MSRELKDAIAQLAGTFNRDFVSIAACTVQTVDPINRQCTCLPLNGSGEAAITVNLSAEPNDGILVKPSAGSTVLVAQTIQNDPFVLMTSDIDGISIITNDGQTELLVALGGSIQFNDGSYGGLIKIAELVSIINTLQNDLNSLKAILAAWTPSGNLADATALKTALSVMPSPYDEKIYTENIITISEISDIENTLIKHGK